MSLQPRIPFKVRKRTQVISKNVKSNDENENILNKPPAKQRKRTKVEDDAPEDETDSCTPSKAPRRSLPSAAKDNSDAPKALVGREEEIAFLEEFLLSKLEKEESASLYISGQPGTGKTASLEYVLRQPKIREGYEQVVVNCTMLKAPGGIFERVARELRLGGGRAGAERAVLRHLARGGRMTLLLLDEADQLESARQHVLYRLFEWPALPRVRLVLLGVANALDLTQRALPRLQARCSLRPAALHFAPYSKAQLLRVLGAELAERARGVSPAALQLLAAKVAAVSGDMRRALDAGRAALEAAQRGAAGEGEGRELGPERVLRALQKVYGGSGRIAEEVDAAFPLQQKLLLCALLLLLRGKSRGAGAGLTLGRLHDAYRRVAEARNLAPLPLAEVLSACALLEARGALSLQGGAGGGRQSRLRLRWDERELSEALRDKPLLASVLAGCP